MQAEQQPLQGVPTTLAEIMEIAEREGIGPNGFTRNYPASKGPNPYGTHMEWVEEQSDWEVQVGLCRQWIREQPKTKTVRHGRGSYGLKHVVERQFGHYVCNGAFLIAAYLEGLVVKRGEYASPNAIFNIGLKR